MNAAGYLLIDDQGNNRIRQVDMVPVANLWNRKLSFPDTLVGQTSGPLTVKFQNSGLASLPISDTVRDGQDPQNFRNFLEQLRGSNASAIVLLRGRDFYTHQPGQRTATLTINTALGPQVVNLSGNGIGQ